MDAVYDILPSLVYFSTRLAPAGNPHQTNPFIFVKIKEYSEIDTMKFPLQSLYSWYRNTLRNPKYRWWIVIGTLVYLISPIDISPDVFPIIGEIDDIALVTLLFAEVSQIAIEKLKQRQPKAGSAPSTSPFSTEATSTVDVNAVPVQE
jgi:uncharacterized membrane protein YkvA (DUF1232 family)